jgi:hypothetical protein
MTGGTLVTLTGKYLLHSDLLPAQIDISGSPCTVRNASSTDPLKAKITCEIQPTESYGDVRYQGSRGVNLTVNQGFVSLGKLSF